MKNRLMRKLIYQGLSPIDGLDMWDLESTDSDLEPVLQIEFPSEASMNNFLLEVFYDPSNIVIEGSTISVIQDPQEHFRWAWRIVDEMRAHIPVKFNKEASRPRWTHKSATSTHN